MGGGRRGLELVWPGKYGPDGQRTPLERRHPTLSIRERVPGSAGVGAGRIILGDNLLALDALADELAGAVDLVYIDPPFATGTEFSVLRKVGGGEGRDPAELRIPAYDDSWPGGAAGLLEMLDPRVRLIHQLLSPTGSLYVHVDPTVGHAVKLLLDDVFGEGCFQREIVWRIGWLSGFKTRAKNWIRNHDLIFFYVKDPERFTFNKSYVPHPPGYRRRDGNPPKSPGVPLEDVWNANETEFALRGRESLDSIQIKSFSREKTGWATQKNESIVGRIIEASSNAGDLVLDAFAGSGTTAAVAAQLGRRFVVCDRSPVACSIARARLLDQPEHGPLELCRVGEVADADSSPKTQVRVKVRTSAQGLVLALEGLQLPASAVPTQLEGVEWSELIEAWAVDWRAREPFTTDFETHRSHRSRELALETAPEPGAARESRKVAVKIWDVLGREATRCFRIGPTGSDQWTVSEV